MKGFIESIFRTFLILLLAERIYCGTYSIIHPKLFRIDSDETVVVNLHDYGNANVRVDAWLTDYPRRNNIFSRKDEGGNTATPIIFTMKATRDRFPNAETMANKKVEMNVRIQFPDGEHSDINSRILIYLTGESDYIFVQTNRPIYKPGQTVDIRVAPLNHMMLPMRGPEDVFEVSVKTSEGVGIWRKTYRFQPNSFINAEYEIPDGAPLGVYRAEAKLISKTHTSTGSAEFKVDKYVLPTYNVEIQLEESTVKPNGEILGTFKARYSYGDPVVGTYGITATLHVSGREPLGIYQKPSTPEKRPGMLRERAGGSGNIRISIRKALTVSNMTWDELVEAGATISVVVSVMGNAERILESDRKDGILITNTPYMIDMSQAAKYFVPSLTHNLNIIVRDIVTKEPVGAQLPLIYSVDGNQIGARPLTNDKGFVRIPIDTQRNSNQLRVTIRTDDSQLNRADQAEVTILLERHDSSNGYLKMSAPSTTAVDRDVHVWFTTEGYQPSEIYYMVLSKGMIVSSGKVQVSQRISATAIRVTRKMSPSIRVVGYFMHRSNIVSDSVSIDIDDVCISRELEIEVTPDEIRPGETVTINYTGERMSMLGTSAVDRAAYFLYKNGRLDRHKMFEKMKSFDMGCSASGGRTPLNVFEEAGLACTTGAASTPSKFHLNCAEEEAAGRKKRSIVQVVEGLSLEQRILMRRCYSDGRKENLADERCEIRVERIYKQEITDENLCVKDFMEGCVIGEGIRNSSEFRATKQRTGSASMDAASHPSNPRRTNFNEGWLWFTERFDRNGRASQSPSPPHSITTYDIDAISVNDAEGFCIAKPAELKVFKDSFIQLYLPYSVKVMEQVQIRAALFNYHETRVREMIVRVKVHESLCSQGSRDSWNEVARLTVPNQSSKSFTFTVIPLSVPETVGGKAVIEVMADPVRAGDDTARDEIRRYLKVEPSGSEVDFSGSFQLDPSLSRPNKQIVLNFPDDDVVPHSRKCWIYGYMSFLGPIIEFDPISEEPKNLKDSIGVPYGCGEQNMMVMGPNVFAFNYLKHIGDPKASTRSEIERLIIAGYTRQQGHRNNRRWSVYNYRQPTIWINAYVDKVFLHARKVWPEMDIMPICDSLAWLVTQQQNDGSFSEQSHATYYHINVAEGGTVALTAYVLISTAETEAECPDAALNSRILMLQDRAATYLRRTIGQNTIPYTAAIVSYALALVDPSHSSTRIANQRLLNMRRQTTDESFWQSRPQPGHVVDIETTAYALLAQVKIAEDRDNGVAQSTVEMVNQIARWMVSQQNDRGGFRSSQTTVIAIQSMTEYAIWINDLEPPPRNPHLDLTLTAAGTTWKRGQRFNLDASHEFYRKELEIPKDVIEGTRTIDVAVSGEGRGSMSFRCVYRTTKNSETCDFRIDATTSRIGHFGDDGESEAAPGEGKEVIKLVLEISKISEGDSGMAIIDISLISGFKPVEASLDAIKDTVDRVVDDYEVTDSNVILYVERIPHGGLPLRLGFKLQQQVTVNGPNPAKIMVYDYYNPKETCTKFYSVPDGSPLIRMSCAPTSIDSTDQQLCKCAEGGCPTCRSREEQLEKTCGSWGECYGCTGDRRNCANLRNSVCSRDYGFIMEITDIDKESMPQFIKMTARVDEVVHAKTSDTELDKDQTRTFVIRKDCFDKCYDVSVKSLTEEGDYFVVGRSFLVRGKELLKSTKSNGDESFDYYLDKESIVERTLSQAKCDRKLEARDRCANENCRDKLKICDNQRAMREGVFEGCD